MFSFNNKNTIFFEGDIIGKFLAMISLAPLGIGSGFVALILFRRDLHTVGLFFSFKKYFLIFFFFRLHFFWEHFLMKF